MFFVFRVDSSQKIGSGHVMRCLTIAEELRDLGMMVEFITRDHQGNINNQINNKEFQVNLLVNPITNQQHNLAGYEQWLGVKQDADADETIQILRGREIDWLIIDHYALDYKWEEKLRPYTKKIMVIDDLANRKHDCDLLLDQNYIHDEDRYNYLLAPDTIKLLGPRYALLRKGFVENKNSRIQNSIIKRLFVFFGGSDLDNLTTVTIKALTQSKLKHLLVDVVIGSSNPYHLELEKEIDKHSNIELHIQIDNIAELMVKADIAIGAGGATTWERMVIGLPSLVVTIADNQVAFTKDLDKDGYIKWLGHYGQVNEQTMYNALLDAINNSNSLQEQSRKCQSLVNGLGAQVVSKLLTKGPDPETLLVRKAKYSDSSLYWLWANDPIVRKNAFNQQTIEWQEHQEWFNNRLNDSNTILLLIQSNIGPIGQVRFNKSGFHYTIGYSLAKQLRGFGLAKIVLSKAIEYLRQENAFTLIGEIKESNFASEKVFKNLGFTESHPPHKKRGEPFSITVLSDYKTWMRHWIGQLLAEWAKDGHRISWVHNPSEVPNGDFCFLLSCSEIVKPNILSRNKHNLVVHASDLPQGKGMSPMSWQILEGQSKIQLTLFEAIEALDAGDIYLQESIILEGHELLDELHAILADLIIKLCIHFTIDYPDILNNAYEQTGEESFYAKRTKNDSKLDINKSLREQFQLLRIVDNEKYPAFFELNGYKYTLRVDKCMVDQ